MPLNRKELEQLLLDTKRKIEETRDQERAVTDPQEKARLKRKRKELQYLQLWNMDQYERLDI